MRLKSRNKIALLVQQKIPPWLDWSQQPSSNDLTIVGLVNGNHCHHIWNSKHSVIWWIKIEKNKPPVFIDSE